MMRLISGKYEAEKVEWGREGKDSFELTTLWYGTTASQVELQHTNMILISSAYVG